MRKSSSRESDQLTKAVLARTESSVGHRRLALPPFRSAARLKEAHRLAAVHAKISDVQRAKMDATMWRDLDRVARSGSIEAMMRDVQLAGTAAFDIHRSNRGAQSG